MQVNTNYNCKFKWQYGPVLPRTSSSPYSPSSSLQPTPQPTLTLPATPPQSSTLPTWPALAVPPTRSPTYTKASPPAASALPATPFRRTPTQPHAALPSRLPAPLPIAITRSMVWEGWLRVPPTAWPAVQWPLRTGTFGVRQQRIGLQLLRTRNELQQHSGVRLQQQSAGPDSAGLLPERPLPLGHLLGLRHSAQIRTSRHIQLIPGCSVFSDPLSCSMILNLCTYSFHSAAAPECAFFSTYALTSLLYADAAGFSLTPTAAPLSLKLVSFSATGNYLGEKSLLLGDIFRCGTPSDSEVGVVFGTNVELACSYNFNHLVASIASKQHQNKLYQLLVQGDSGLFYEVPVLLPGSSQGTRRFFLEDAYSSSTKINVLTSLLL